MNKKTIITIYTIAFIFFLFITIFIGQANAAESNWTFSAFGIQHKHLKDRNVIKVVSGAILSYLTHEAGHSIYSHINGHSPRLEWTRTGIEVWTDNANQEFYSAGFISQLLVGSILTLIPETRHSDYTLGFNGWTTFGTSVYMATRGLGSNKTSDIQRLKNGDLIGGFVVGTGSMLMSLNLKTE